MNDSSSDDARSMEARVTKVGEAIGERVQSATAATAASGRPGEKSAGRCGRSRTASLVASGPSGGGRRRCGSLYDQFRFAADRRDPIDRCSGRLRARLRRGPLDSRTTVDQEEPQTIGRMEPQRRSGWT